MVSPSPETPFPGMLEGPFPPPNVEGAWVRYLWLPVFGLWALAELDRCNREDRDEDD